MVSFTPSVTILVVEDEELICALLEDTLRDGGYDLVVAHSGQKALQELEKNAERFRAVLTDIRLGDDISGWDLARRARELKPHIPIIYMSGDSADDWQAKGVPNSVMVPKPFAPSQVVTAVSSLLNYDDTTG